MVAEKRTEGDIQVTQSGITSCSGQDVPIRENCRITVMDTHGGNFSLTKSTTQSLRLI